MTLGQVFAKGDVPAGTSVRGSDMKGREVAVQLDQTTRFDDGSLRFAVISALLRDASTGAVDRIDLWRVGDMGSAAARAVAAPRVRAASGAVNVRIDLHSPQIAMVDFGAFGTVPKAIPFRAGETVSIEVDDGRISTFSVLVTPEMAGGDVGSFYRLSKAFQVAIEKLNHGYLAYKVGPGDGYGKLWITASLPRRGAFKVRVNYHGEARIVVTELQPFRSTKTLAGTIDPATSNNKSRSWLSGPVATEREFQVPLAGPVAESPNPHLSLRARWREYPSAEATRLELVFENMWAFEPGPQNWLYDVTVLHGNRVLLARTGILHHHHARWREVLWLSGHGEPEVWHDRGYLLSSGAFPPYDPAVIVPEDVIARQYAKLLAADMGPMGAARVTTYMPAQGGRPDIGPLPQWAALYLLSMDQRAKAEVLANGNAGATMPIHYRDRLTDQPVSLDRHPGLAMVFGTATAPPDALPKPLHGQTIWSPDTAHLPSLAFVPYLVTGELFYFEEMSFWANWVMGAVNPVFRDGTRGLLHRDQVRGQAWALRTLAEAAVFAPDADPLKEYFSSRLANNIAWYRQRYVDNIDPAQSARLGFLAGEELMLAPWMQDFMYLVVARMADLGVAGARDLADWVARFSVGRWQAEKEGYCRAMAPAYYVKIRPAPKAAFFGSMRELFAANWPDVKACPSGFIGGYPDLSGGYVAIGHAVLAQACGHGHGSACDAWRKLRQDAPAMVGGFQNDPTFAFAPRNH